MVEQQTIPARHGTATFVPAGQVIKIINTSGTQVVDTWAFALPNPEPKEGSQEQKEAEQSKQQATTQTPPAKKKKAGKDLPSQEEAEKATQEGLKEGEAAAEDGKKSGWSSYVPSLGWSSAKKEPSDETEQQKNSRTWSSYFPSGQGFSNYIPKTATDTVSSFASTHKRDPNKSYLEQLQEFSKTPVGAAGWSGLAALTGSGYGGSMYAGYQAYNAQSGAQAAMEYMSMPHTRAATLHMVPRVDDVLVSNLREPIMTLVEDTSPGVHDTLIAACDPPRYKGLGVENWMEHGSCAENLVLALKELNERAGLKGNKGVGADVTINSVPAPLNLFMNIPWDDTGDIGFHAPKSKKDDYVRLKAERDVVVVMSACPQDVLDINGKNPTDAHFIVEGGEEPKAALKRTAVKKRPPPKKVAASRATSTTAGTENGAAAPPAAKKAVRQKKAVPAKRPAAPAASTTAPKPAAAAAQPAKKKPVPKPVQPQKTASAAADGEAAPVKKKPRKLAPKAKPATQTEG